MTATLDRKRFAFGTPGRIQGPNSKPRSIALVGIGEGGAAIARNMEDEELAQLDVHVFARSSTRGDALAAIQAGGGDLRRNLTDSDMIFMVACQGDDVGLAPVVSGIAHSRGHPVTALYIVPQGVDFRSEAEDETLKTLREGVEVLVIVSDESYVPAMIAALGG